MGGGRSRGARYVSRSPKREIKREEGKRAGEFEDEGPSKRVKAADFL